MNFVFNWVIFRFQPLIFQGVFPCGPKDIFQNGVSCQRMLWQCDRQHYWFLSYLPLGLMIMANQPTPPNVRALRNKGLIRPY